jgi:hypothetical protein
VQVKNIPERHAVLCCVAPCSFIYMYMSCLPFIVVIVVCVCVAFPTRPKKEQGQRGDNAFYASVMSLTLLPELPTAIRVCR